MSSMSIMDSVEKHEYRTLDDLRVRAKLKKADVYRGVGVAKSTYRAWEEGKSLPDLPNAIALAKVLKTPLDIVCKALGLDMDGVPSVLSQDSIVDNPLEGALRDNRDFDALVRVLQQSPKDDAAAILRLIINKKDDGPIPPSGLPT